MSAQDNHGLRIVCPRIIELPRDYGLNVYRATFDVVPRSDESNIGLERRNPTQRAAEEGSDHHQDDFSELVFELKIDEPGYVENDYPNKMRCRPDDDEIGNVPEETEENEIGNVLEETEDITTENVAALEDEPNNGMAGNQPNESEEGNGVGQPVRELNEYPEQLPPAHPDGLLDGLDGNNINHIIPMLNLLNLIGEYSFFPHDANPEPNGPSEAQENIDGYWMYGQNNGQIFLFCSYCFCIFQSQPFWLPHNAYMLDYYYLADQNQYGYLYLPYSQFCNPNAVPTYQYQYPGNEPNYQTPNYYQGYGQARNPSQSEPNNESNPDEIHDTDDDQDGNSEQEPQYHGQKGP